MRFGLQWYGFFKNTAVVQLGFLARVCNQIGRLGKSFLPFRTGVLSTVLNEKLGCRWDEPIVEHAEKANAQLQNLKVGGRLLRSVVFPLWLPVSIRGDSPALEVVRELFVLVVDMELLTAHRLLDPRILDQWPSGIIVDVGNIESVESSHR